MWVLFSFKLVVTFQTELNVGSEAELCVSVSFAYAWMKVVS